MEMPIWSVGSEERFAAFVGTISTKDTVAIVSHNVDLDGIVSAKVLAEVFPLAEVFFVDYEDLNEEFVARLKGAGVTRVIVADLNFKRREVVLALGAFAQVLVIVHHQMVEDFTSERTTVMNAQGMCAAYLCFELFSERYSLEHLDWAVACASLSDWVWKKNGEWLGEVFAKFGERFEGTEEGVKRGVFWEFQASLNLALIAYRKRGDSLGYFDAFPESFRALGKLEDALQIVQQEVERATQVYAEEHEMMRKRIFWEFRGSYPVRELMINVQSHELPSATFVFLERAGEVIKCSFRRQNGGEDVSILARKLVEGFENSDGGGHKAASGCVFPAKYLAEFKKRLEIL